jgi:hypothetical protein
MLDIDQREELWFAASVVLVEELEAAGGRIGARPQGG